MPSRWSPSRQSQGRNCAAMRFDLQWIQGFTVEYVTPLSTSWFSNVPQGSKVSVLTGRGAELRSDEKNYGRDELMGQWQPVCAVEASSEKQVLHPSI